MKNSKKLLFAMLPVLAMSLVGCGNGGGGGQPDQEIEDTYLPADYKANISILIPNGNANEKTMVEEAIKVFNTKWPDVTVNLKYVAVKEWENTVRNQNIAGTLPDIVWSNSPDYYYLIDSKIGLNLTPYLKGSEQAGDFDFDVDFYTEYFDMGSKDGKLYCVPRSCDSVVTFYNKELLNAAKIDMSDMVNGWSWETFMSKLDLYRKYLDLNGKSNYYCLDMNLFSWLSVNYPILASYGGSLFDKNLNITVDSEETRKALTMIREMVDKRYIPYKGVTASNNFEGGTCPFLFQSSSISHYDKMSAIKGKIDIVSFPKIDANSTPKIGCGIAGYAINAKTQHKVACWQLINTMISYDGQQAMALGDLNLPSVRKDLQDPATANWMKGYTDRNLAAYTYGGEYKIDPKFLSWVKSTQKSDLSTALCDMFENVTRTDKGTAIECIEYAVKTCVDDIKYALDY